MHSPFGPFYVTPLQQTIDHAERLVRPRRGLFRESLFHDFSGPDNRAVWRAIWIVGRAQEVEALVADVTQDWRRRLLSAVAAASVLERYLDGLHEAMRDTFDLARPACCAPLRITAEDDAIHSDATAQISVTRGARTPSLLSIPSSMGRASVETPVTPRIP